MKRSIWVLVGAIAVTAVCGSARADDPQQDVDKSQFIQDWRANHPHKATPIPISLEERFASSGWTDWIGVSYGMSFPLRRVGKPLILLELNRDFNSSLVDVAVPNEEGLYSIDRVQQTSLTRAFRLAHWRELQQYQREKAGGNYGGTLAYLRRLLLEEWHGGIGFFTQKLQTAEQEQGVEDIQGYFAGAVKTISPYANVHIGFALYERDHRVRGPMTFGFTLDLAVLGKIFK